METCFLSYSFYITTSIFVWTGKAPNVYYLALCSKDLLTLALSPVGFSSLSNLFLHCLHSQGQGRLLLEGSWEVWCGANHLHSPGDAGYSVASRQRSPPWPPREAQALFFLGVHRTLFRSVPSCHWTTCFWSTGSLWHSVRPQPLIGKCTQIMCWMNGL